jgi:hypothetical protein
MGSSEGTLVRMHALMREGRADEAMRHAIATLDQGHGAPLLELARHCATHGRPRLALDLLMLVGGARADLLPALVQEEAFASLRDDPRFLQLAGAL